MKQQELPPTLPSEPTSGKRDLARAGAALLTVLLMATAILAGRIINPDGVLYIDTAQAFLDKGLSGALASYPWPFYPILIGLVSHLSGLSMLHSAYLVNTVCIVILADAFIRLCRLVGSAGHLGWVPVLLFFAFRGLDHRLEIIRDWGFLAFSLLGFVHFTRFWLDPRGRLADALAWQVAIAVACLFRIEAAAFMILAPLGLLAQAGGRTMRLRRWLLASCWIVPALGLLAGLALSGHLPASRLDELYLRANPLLLWHTFTDRATLLSNAILNEHSRDLAQLILGTGLIASIAYMTLANFGNGLLLACAWCLYRGRRHVAVKAGPIYWVLAINVLILLVFLAQTPIMVNRYALLASLLLLALLSPYVADALQAVPPIAESTVGRLSRPALAILLGVIVLTGFIKLPPSNLFINDAALWIKGHVTAGERIIINDTRLQFLAGISRDNPAAREVPEIRLALQNTPPPFYLALYASNKEMNDFAATLGCLPQVAEFRARNAPRSVHIYKIDDVPAAWKQNGFSCPQESVAR
ncbi:hypothetical protein [Thauera sp. 2A1]|uniref:hypothetical protein n=1 Tax=Thauera sp. 2A1 TaxID=2570191 RepID=UPI001291B857|nr:hypothetical protein [Thauera sp. 2A1]KAI5914798.1 hypothetical protein GH664_11300 [Thauera sp. 2A1]